MNSFENGAPFTDEWLDDHFEEKLESGDLVYVEAYGRRIDALDEWQYLRGAGFVGTVSPPPTAASRLNGISAEDGVNITPYVPEPAGDQYAIGHPLFVRHGEKVCTVKGQSFLVRHTVELITSDNFNHAAEIEDTVPHLAPR